MSKCPRSRILLTWDEGVPREEVERFIERLQEEVAQQGGALVRVDVDESQTNTSDN